MKSLVQRITLCVLIGTTGSLHALDVKVDSSQTWLGYMNVFNLPPPSGDGVYQFGSSWGTADLVAVFNSGSLTITPNTIGDPNPYWYTPSGGPGATGNKIMEANFYVQLGAPTGETVNFSGNVTGFTLSSTHTTKAFIKDFAPDYSSFNVSEVVIDQTGAFNISLATSNDPARHLQYGFQTVGPCVWFTDVGPLGSVVIQDEPAPFVPDQIINGDFEIADGAGWGTTQGTPSFPTTEGNPNGHAVLDGTDGFTVLYAFNNSEKTFASLGLAPGDTYTIQMDMKITNGGTNIGGIRLEGPAGYVVEQYPAIIGDGSEWATYSIELTVPASPAQAKFGLRPGAGSIVAFDNVMIVPPAPAGPLQATIAQGTSVSWTATNEANQYQPQQSSDNSDWSNLGPAFVGTAVSSVFDATPSPFYRVLESAPSVQETVYNGNFSEEGLFSDEAEGWNGAGSQFPTRLATGGRGDNGPCMQIQAVNIGTNPTSSEIQQNTNNVFGHENGEIVPGNTYSLSFWAKQISIGTSYVQEYRVSFLADGGAELPPGGGAWQTFAATVGGDWEQKVLNGLVAPEGAVTALIQIVGKTGAVEGGLGEVLIDDVSLESTGFGTPSVLAAATVPAVEISWPSKTGQDYQVRSSTNLVDWSDFGGVISGDNNTKAVYDIITPPAKFYKVGELP